MMTLGDLVSATDINVCKKKKQFFVREGGMVRSSREQVPISALLPVYIAFEHLCMYIYVELQDQ